MRPDLAAIRVFLARVARRLAWMSAAHGAAAGLGVAMVLALLGWPRPDAYVPLVVVGATAVVIGILISVSLTADRRRRAPIDLERRVPESRNLILTAAELSARPADGYVTRLVFGEAARLVARLDPATLFPARSAVAAVGVAFAAWLLVIARPILPMPAVLGGPGSASATSRPTVDGFDVTIEPPQYTGRAKQTVRDPARIELLAGSTIALSVRARANRVMIETLESQDSLVQRGSTFTGTLAADAGGYIAIQPTTGNTVGSRRLIGLTVVADSPPRVRIATPGHDLRVPDGRRTLDIGIEASDDIALASLKLRFTRVSGSGERFTFAEGDVPLAIVRRDERTWTARAMWKLDSLELGPGDMVVYRAIAADRRGLAGTSESDSFIAEILALGGVAAPGFAVDPEQDRYAVSQQMVIQKTEGLVARRATMSSDDFASESQQLAAEQRKVRAEFVFMLGGELADAPDAAESMTEINEEEEAEREGEILAGRNANAGHIALLRAIRAMSRAAATLTNVEPTTALPYERTALRHLESAFSHSRILLRALTTRERLDLSRRMTGVLTDAVRDVQPVADPEVGSATVALRRVLSDIAALAGAKQLDQSAATQATLLAERVLRVDAASPALQDVANQLASAASAMAADRSGAARELLDQASVGVVATLREKLLSAPSRTPGIGEARMNGALVDALRSRKQR